MASTASIPGSSSTTRNACSNSSAGASTATSTGLAVDAVAGRMLARRAPGRGAQFRHEQSVSCSGVGGEYRRTCGVPDDGEASSAWHRLAGECLRRVEQLLQRVDTCDAGARQHERGDIVGSRQRCRVRPRSVGSDMAASGFHRDDRLGLRHSGRYPDELSRVAERLEVERNDGRRDVALPISQQVVAGDVGLVADRHEARDADAAASALVDQRDAERARLRHERDVSRDGIERRKGGVHADEEVGVRQSHAVGPDDPHAIAPGRLDEICLRRAPIGAELREAGADDHDATDMRRHRIRRSPRRPRSQAPR